MAKLDEKKILRRIMKLQKEIMEIGPLYKELDDLTERLVKTRRKRFELSTKIEARLFDNFAQSNTKFKATAFKRWELLFIDKSKKKAA